MFVDLSLSQCRHQTNIFHDCQNGPKANGGGRQKKIRNGKEIWDKSSIKTRSDRAGSVGSAKAPAMTNVGPFSESMRDGTAGTRDLNISPSGSTIGSEITCNYSLPLSSNCKTIND